MPSSERRIAPNELEQLGRRTAMRPRAAQQAPEQPAQLVELVGAGNICHLIKVIL